MRFLSSKPQKMTYRKTYKGAKTQKAIGKLINKAIGAAFDPFAKSVNKKVKNSGCALFLLIFLIFTVLVLSV